MEKTATITKKPQETAERRQKESLDAAKLRSAISEKLPEVTRIDLLEFVFSFLTSAE